MFSIEHGVAHTADAAATDPSWPLHVPPASAVGETVDVAGIIAELRIIRAQLGPVNGIEELIADMEWTLDFLSNPENPAHVSLERARHLAHIHHLGSNFCRFKAVICAGAFEPRNFCQPDRGVCDGH